MPERKRKNTAAVILGHAGRVDPEEVRLRLAERDAREANDNRTPAQRWLGDPPADRSALARAQRINLVDLVYINAPVRSAAHAREIVFSWPPKP